MNHPNQALIGVPGGRRRLDTPALLIELTCREATLELAIHAARALPTRVP